MEEQFSVLLHKVTEYLCSGWVFISSDKFRLLYNKISLTISPVYKRGDSQPGSKFTCSSIAPLKGWQFVTRCKREGDSDQTKLTSPQAIWVENVNLVLSWHFSQPTRIEHFTCSA